MSPPAEYSVPTLPASPVTRLTSQVGRHPAGALLVAAGLGFAAVLVVRALMPPPPPRNRAVQTLEDILHRLKALAQPAYNRAAGLAEDGAHAVGKGWDGLGTLHLDRKCDNLWRAFTGLFH